MIASHLGAILCEWKTPTPTIWQEHVHNSGSGMITPSIEINCVLFASVCDLVKYFYLTDPTNGVHTSALGYLSICVSN